ncbi:hypothetical protein SEVIR_9G088501v4 [Setaria viridis]|uniref:Uncharacterized protein n=1 Tax=Setaria viridis TaxID=4556 RepID=A0A4U6STR7_SETVI|nr:hypothetical protein SEVIR_9G088501v2 [Setaria viridis]
MCWVAVRRRTAGPHGPRMEGRRRAAGSVGLDSSNQTHYGGHARPPVAGRIDARVAVSSQQASSLQPPGPGLHHRRLPPGFSLSLPLTVSRMLASASRSGVELEPVVCCAGWRHGLESWGATRRPRVRERAGDVRAAALDQWDCGRRHGVLLASVCVGFGMAGLRRRAGLGCGTWGKRVLGRGMGIRPSDVLRFTGPCNGFGKGVIWFVPNLQGCAQKLLPPVDDISDNKDSPASSLALLCKKFM